MDENLNENNLTTGPETQTNGENSLPSVVVPVRNLKNLLENLRIVLAENSELKQFCLDKFGALPQIIIGIDLEDLPDAPEGAIICIATGSRSRIRGDAYRSHNVSIVGAVKCISRTADITTDYNTLTLDALGVIDDFINIVEKIVFPSVQSWGVAITQTEGDPDEVIYPYARAELAYRFDIHAKI
jgi:hypothetical protein